MEKFQLSLSYPRTIIVDQPSLRAWRKQKFVVLFYELVIFNDFLSQRILFIKVSVF